MKLTRILTVLCLTMLSISGREDVIQFPLVEDLNEVKIGHLRLVASSVPGLSVDVYYDNSERKIRRLFLHIDGKTYVPRDKDLEFEESVFFGVIKLYSGAHVKDHRIVGTAYHVVQEVYDDRKQKTYFIIYRFTKSNDGEVRYRGRFVQEDA